MVRKKEICELCGEGKCKCGETKKKNKIKIRFCPKCKSTNVKFVFGLKNIFGIIPKMECQDCKYYAVDFPIIEVSKEELNKINKKRKNKNE